MRTMSIVELQAMRRLAPWPLDMDLQEGRRRLRWSMPILWKFQR